MTYTVSSGALNSTPTNQPLAELPGTNANLGESTRSAVVRYVVQTEGPELFGESRRPEQYDISCYDRTRSKKVIIVTEHPTVRLTIIWYSITHSLFHSRLKTFLFCKSFPLQPFVFLLQDLLYIDSPDCLLLFLNISVFYF